MPSCYTTPDIISLPLQLGGLGLANPAKLSPILFTSATLTAIPLVLHRSPNHLQPILSDIPAALNKPYLAELQYNFNTLASLPDDPAVDAVAAESTLANENQLTPYKRARQTGALNQPPPETNSQNPLKLSYPNGLSHYLQKTVTNATNSQQQQTPSPTPSQNNTAPNHPTPYPLQKKLTSYADNRLFRATILALENLDTHRQFTNEPHFSSRAHLISNAGVGASDWLLATPHHSTNIPDSIFRLTLSRRLHLPLAVPNPAPTCGASSQKTNLVCGAPLDRALLHSLTCPKGGGFYFTHERVNNTLTDIAKDVFGNNCVSNSRYEIEASLGNRPETQNNNWVVPDGLIRTYPRSYWDVTTVSANATPFQILAHISPGTAARRAENAKRKTYAYMFQSGLISATTYSTFAIEHGGRLGAEATALLKKFALHRQACLGQPSDCLLQSGKLFIKRWLQCISVSFQTAQSLRIQATLDRILTGYGSIYQVVPPASRYSPSLHAIQRLLAVH